MTRRLPLGTTQSHVAPSGDPYVRTSHYLPRSHFAGNTPGAHTVDRSVGHCFPPIQSLPERVGVSATGVTGVRSPDTPIFDHTEGRGLDPLQ